MTQIVSLVLLDSGDWKHLLKVGQIIGISPIMHDIYLLLGCNLLMKKISPSSMKIVIIPFFPNKTFLVKEKLLNAF